MKAGFLLRIWHRWCVLKKGGTGEVQARTAKAASPDAGRKPHRPDVSHVPLLDAQLYRGASEEVLGAGSTVAGLVVAAAHSLTAGVHRSASKVVPMCDAVGERSISF